jgi:hypothetical protein
VHLLDEFARAFHQADRVVVLDIYAASEKPIEGVTAEALVDRMRQFGHRGAEYAGSNDAGVEAIVQGVEPGDMILTLGRGKRIAVGRQNSGETECLSRRAPKIEMGTGGWARLIAWAGVAAGVALGGAGKVASFLLRDPRFAFGSAIPSGDPPAPIWKFAARFTPTARAYKTSSRRTSGAAFSAFRWPNGAGGCWPSTG